MNIIRSPHMRRAFFCRGAVLSAFLSKCIDKVDILLYNITHKGR